MTRALLLNALRTKEEKLEAAYKEHETALAALNKWDQEHGSFKIGDRVRYGPKAFYRADRGKLFEITKLYFHNATGEVTSVWGRPVKKDGTVSMRQPRYLHGHESLQKEPV